METKTKFTCQYCRKDFARETSLAVHVCEQKRRRQERTERGVELGFQAYVRFYEMSQGSAKFKTYDDFCDSPYYRAFTKFGRYCVNTCTVNPKQFLEWLLKNNKKIDRWASDQLYTEYLIDYLRVENVNDALARAIEFGIDWGEKHEANAHDCLRYGNHNGMCHAVSTGRISPWVIYNSESGQKFLSELNSEQLAMIWPYIDSDVWQKKFADYRADQEYVKDILDKAGW
jgi:hypothetical protein